MYIGRLVFFQQKGPLPHLGDAHLYNFWNFDTLHYIADTLIGGIAIWVLFLISTGYLFYRINLRLDYKSLNEFTKKVIP